MTPPDKSDASGSNGTAAGSSAPPWQRVGKDGDATSDSAAGAESETVRVSSAALSGDDALYSRPQQDGPPVSEQDYPVVSGTAARKLFGDSGEDSEAKTREVPMPAAAGRARPTPTPTALRRPGRGPRRASLQIKRFDPWSVLKLSLVLGVAMFFVWLVAVGVLYTVLDGMGVWGKLNGTYDSLVGGEGAAQSTDPLISAGRVFGIAAILGAINIVLVSALATVSAFIYNVSADLAGGLEVTLSERE